MALLVYQNQLSYDLIIPGWESTFHLYPNEYVAGEYYSQFPPSMLTDVTSQNIPVGDIKYIYPGSTDGPSEGGAIDSINGVTPILTSTLLGVTTISLDTLTGSLFGPGQIVKGINGLTDLITIEGGAGISVDSLTDTITINNTQLGLTSVTATAPLYLTLGEGNVSLEGSIAITPLNDGGAVALQDYSATPTIQQGIASLNSLDLQWKSTESLEPNYGNLLVGRANQYYAERYISSVLKASGTYNLAGYVNSAAGMSSISIKVFDELTFDNTTGQITDLNADPYIQLTSSGSYIDVSRLRLRGNIDLSDESYFVPGRFGSISGEQDAAATSPFIGFRSIQDQTIPLISLESAYVSGTTNSSLFLDVLDSNGDTLISLHGDGIVTAKTIEADTVNVTTLNADNIYVTSYAAAGPTTINVTTAGPQTIMGDCSIGTIVVQLPDLNTFDKSLSVTIIKTDNSNNSISILNGPNSTINGSTLAVDLVDQYETLTITSNGINWYKIGAM